MKYTNSEDQGVKIYELVEDEWWAIRSKRMGEPWKDWWVSNHTATVDYTQYQREKFKTKQEAIDFCKKNNVNKQQEKEININIFGYMNEDNEAKFLLFLESWSSVLKFTYNK